MLKSFALDLIHRLGFDIQRRQDSDLPFFHVLKFDDQEINFWITNSHAKQWWNYEKLGLHGELRMLKKICQPGDVVFDIGAHHGMLSIAFSLWAGSQGKVYSFEANPENTIVLQANILSNQLFNCACYFSAVGDTSGTLFMTGESASAKGSKGRETPMVSLDDFCVSQGIEKVDLIKIDVEGFECQVLEGAVGLLKKCPKLAIEIHQDDMPRYGGSIQKISELVDLARYKISAVVRDKSWNEIISIEKINDIPDRGIINIFMEPYR